MAIVRTSSKGQIVIPGSLRRKLGLKSGQRVNIKLSGEKKLELVPIPDDPVEAYCGIFKRGKSLTDSLIAERCKDIERE